MFWEQTLHYFYFLKFYLGVFYDPDRGILVNIPCKIEKNVISAVGGWSNLCCAVLVTQSCLTVCDPMFEPARLLCPWDSPGKNTWMGCHALLQRIFPARDRAEVSHTAGGFFTIWTTREVVSRHQLYSVGWCQVQPCPHLFSARFVSFWERVFEVSSYDNGFTCFSLQVFLSDHLTHYC